MSNNVNSDPSAYCYASDSASHTQKYLWAPVKELLQQTNVERVFELGCGNGALSYELTTKGFDVSGVDPSEDGIRIANQRKEKLDTGAAPQLQIGSAYDDLQSQYGQFPAVISLEVVEHVYFPRKYAKCVHDLLEPGGIAIVSTPYHGYTKNLALAIFGKLDDHFTALWDHGHIKFWSIKTLTQLFAEHNMPCEKVLRVGRFPMFAKSMILVFRKQ